MAAHSSTIKSIQRDLISYDARWKDLDELESKVDRDLSSIASEMASTRSSVKSLERTVVSHGSRIGDIEAQTIHTAPSASPDGR